MADYDSEILRKLQLTILEILKDIDKVCKENDIEYLEGCLLVGLKLYK